LGTGFFVHHRIASAVKRVEVVSDRVSYVVLRGRWFNIIVLNVPALTEEKSDDSKESFYAVLERDFNDFPNYHMKIVLGYFNPKVGREYIFKPPIQNESLHEASNDNGVRIVNFTTSKNLDFKSMMFPHRNIHKYTWTFPDGQSGSPPEVKGLIWYTDGSKMKEGTGAGVYGQSLKRRLGFPLSRYTTVFQAEIYAILACVYEIQLHIKSEKYISICSDSQVALKVLRAVRTTSPLVSQCQKMLNDTSVRHAVGLFWVPGHAG
jgi:hypothetical protein